MKCEEDYKQTPLPGLKRYKLEKTVKSSFLRLYLPEMPSGAYMPLCRDHRHRQLGREAGRQGEHSARVAEAGGTLLLLHQILFKTRQWSLSLANIKSGRV